MVSVLLISPDCFTQRTGQTTPTICKFSSISEIALIQLLVQFPSPMGRNREFDHASGPSSEPLDYMQPQTTLA